ncbi:hypothetical protein G9A89_007830 [Geosiphon pyriformis]|nr:hypothetical protein G9A89_007830 [Geosiphon pyriformis]
MVELYAIALALECVLSSYFVDLFTDSQTVLDVSGVVKLLGIAEMVGATVSPSIAIMKKIANNSGSGESFRLVLSRKKRKGDALKEDNSETGDITESDSINMKKECLVKETSFDYGEGNVLANDKVVGKMSQVKYALVKKLFSRINGFGEVSTFSKFAGIIRVTFISEFSLAQATKKAKVVNAVVVKKIPVGTLAKAVCTALFEFGIIKSIKIQLMKLWQKAVVEFDQPDQANLVAVRWSILIGKNVVHVTKSDLDKKIWNIRDYHRILLYILPMGTNAHNIWDFIGSVSGKTCVINCHLVTYAWARCAVVCFKSAKFLNGIMDSTLVLRNVNLYWSHMGFFKCTKYGKIGHMSLGCSVGGDLSSKKSSHRILSDIDKSRLVTIYIKHLVFVACFVVFGEVSWTKIANRSSFFFLPVHNDLVNFGSSSEMKPTLLVTEDIEKKFAVLESGFVSLTEQINELAKKLDLLMLAVFQLSPGCQLPVTLLSQIQVGNIVMGKSLGGTTSSETAANLDFSASLKMKRLENMLKGLFASVLSLTARFDDSILAGGAFLKLFFQ